MPTSINRLDVSLLLPLPLPLPLLVDGSVVEVITEVVDVPDSLADPLLLVDPFPSVVVVASPSELDPIDVGVAVVNA